MTQPDIQIKERPNPQKAHRIEMVIENAPGPFAVIEGAANYSVKNHFECGHIDPVPGIASRITTHPAIEWTPIGDGRYAATVYEDLIVDEDYYGRGVCRWELTEVSVLLKATASDKDTPFLSSISAKDIRGRAISSAYFWRGAYPSDVGYEGLSVYGASDMEKFKPELRQDLFMVRFAAEEVAK